MNISNLAQPWIQIGARLHAIGIFAGTQGSMSERYPEGSRSTDGEMIYPGSFLVTGRDAHKGALSTEQFALLTHGPVSLAGGEPSMDWRLHQSVYRLRRDANAIVHAHPPYATALALAGVALPADLLPELAVDFGVLALVPYATPGTEASADAIAKQLGDACGALLERHGVLTLGETPERAAARMERLERAAQIYVLSRLLLGAPPRRLDAEEVTAALAAARERAPLSD